MRIAMFGGSFDPPHFGHLIFAEHARCALQLDHVLFIPAAHSPFKPAEMAGRFDCRATMVSLAIAGNEHFIMENTEIHRGGTSYTVDTLRTLQRTYNPTSLFLLMGSDAFWEFPLWKDPDEITALAQIGVGQRPGSLPSVGKHPFVEHSVIFDSPLIDISSSMIRQRIRNHLSVRYLLPESVRSYITVEGLYLEND